MEGGALTLDGAHLYGTNVNRHTRQAVTLRWCDGEGARRGGELLAEARYADGTAILMDDLGRALAWVALDAQHAGFAQALRRSDPAHAAERDPRG